MISRRISRLRCAALVFWAVSGPHGFCETRHVLVLYDERTELPGLAMIDAGIRRSLASATDRIEIYRESMDNSRFGSDSYRNVLRDHLHAKYAGKKIDVAVAVMEPAMDFLLANRATLLAETPQTPIVFCGIDRRTFGNRPLPSGVTGVLLKREFAPTLELALKLHPGTKQVVVVGGSSDFDTSLLKQALEEFRAFKDRVAFSYPVRPLRELLSELSRLPPHTLVLYTTMFRDAANEPYVPHDVVERISAAANAPVYGFVDQYLGRGIVGGRVYSLRAHGEAVGEMVLKLLAGASAADILPIEPPIGVTAFDRRQLKRWNVSKDRLPSGSVVLFREPTTWERYRGRIIAVALIVLAQAAIISILLTNLVRRRRAEQSLVENENRMRLIAEAANLGMWVWNLADKVMWVSSKWKEIHGYALETRVYYDDLIERVHPEDRERVQYAIAEAFSERSSFYLQHRMLLPNGAVRWISQIGRLEEVGKDGAVRLLGISIDITERREAEQAARQVSGKLITAQEDERRRIARDLHDDLNQRLALLSVETDLLGRMKTEAPARELIADIASHLSEISSEVHKISYQLHPAKLDQLGLVSATRSFCHELTRQFRTRVEFLHDEIPRDLDRDVSLCLYRLVQEGLQNMVKHSHATAARVELRRVGTELRLVISDNGSGFDLRTVNQHAGLGFTGMRERVRLLQGRVEFHSMPGKGTRIEASVPLALGST